MALSRNGFFSSSGVWVDTTDYDVDLKPYIAVGVSAVLLFFLLMLLCRRRLNRTPDFIFDPKIHGDLDEFAIRLHAQGESTEKERQYLMPDSSGSQSESKELKKIVSVPSAPSTEKNSTKPLGPGRPNQAP